MGCSASRLDNEEAVLLCRDRKNFIKQALEQHAQFGAGHIAYIQSLRGVSAALRNYVEGDEDHSFYSPPHLNPVKRLSPGVIDVPLKSFSPALDQSDKRSSRMIHYSRSGGNAAVSAEERPQSPETVRIDSYYSVDPYGMDGLFSTQESHTHTTFFSASPYSRPSYPPPSPSTSQWDFFWNPFSPLDAYEYPSSSGPNWTASDDETVELRQVREEEGIPDLEEEGEELPKPENVEGRAKPDATNLRKEASADYPGKVNTKSDTIVNQLNGCESRRTNRVVSQTQNAIELKVNSEQELENREAADETPGFTVYVNKRPNSMEEVMMEVDNQFLRIYDSAREISMMLEASKSQYSSNSHELTDVGYETSSDFSEESCMMSGSHQSTLDRLYEWEKKLYEEVKSGERMRITYEKKCMQLQNQEVNGGDPSVMGKTKAALRNLHTQIKISVRSVETISTRIETLRDEELQPQLMELIQGLARMWRTMADCHQIQKRTIDQAKLLLATTPKALMATPPTRLSRSAAALEAELRNWRTCFHAWVAAQRSYVRALVGWLLRCAWEPLGGDNARSPLSPPRPSGAPPVFGLCMQWSRMLDGIAEVRAIEGLDFFAAGIASVAGQQREAEAAARKGAGGGRAVNEMAGEEEEEGGLAEMTPEKMAEVAVRVLCAGLSVALAALAEFSAGSRDAYEELHRRGAAR
ncbi:hypothetical protein Taro_030380 [Colocasia esculenta]|uniref:Uncharacterized protein n=1 Tax=Colocasia esculenta TaxID=4460 RepID=A0A843VVY3_COLES|nr:hypothetical protein [Colocasia esculenta]